MKNHGSLLRRKMLKTRQKATMMSFEEKYTFTTDVFFGKSGDWLGWLGWLVSS